MHPDLKVGALSPEQLGESLQALFPVRSTDGTVVLEFVQPHELEDGALRATFRMIEWDIDGETRSIRGVKEQEVYLLDTAMRNEPDRVRTYLRALVRVLPDVLVAAAAEYVNPDDVLDTDALSLRRAETEEDFVTALRAKTRLGKWLPPAA